MATDIKQISFTDGADLRVVHLTFGDTYDATAIEFQEHGVIVEHTLNEVDYRVFVPWEQVKLIYEVL
jgi:hypothetical protein